MYKCCNTIHVIVVVDINGTKPNRDGDGLVGVGRAVGGGSQLCGRWKKKKVFYLLGWWLGSFCTQEEEDGKKEMDALSFEPHAAYWHYERVATRALKELAARWTQLIERWRGRNPS